MNKKIIWGIGFFIFLGLGLLFICHLRYPFLNSASAGWSLGMQQVDNPLEPEVSSQVIFTPEWLNQFHQDSTTFLADPFVIKEDDIYYVFFEHKATEENADIALMTSTDGINFGYKGEVLQEDFHLSFPQVFKHGADFYMIPETKEAENILLYKAATFPYDWKIHDTLVENVALKDPAILLSDSLNLITAIDDRNQQFVFTAASLEGPWNRDNRFETRKGDETRAGGNFFRLKGKWYLPLQKNNEGYGSGLALYQLISNEEHLAFLEISDPFMEGIPEIKWFNKGMHHFSVIPDGKKYYSVFDGDRINEELPKSVAWKASLKYNYYDLVRSMGL